MSLSAAFICAGTANIVTAGISPQVEDQSSSVSSDAALLIFQPLYSKNTLFFILSQQDIIKDLFKLFALDLCFALALGPSDQCVNIQTLCKHTG